MTRAAIAIVAGAASLLMRSGVARGFALDDVAARAQQLAAEAYLEPKGQVPDWLLRLSYDQWRQIRFRSKAALWRDRKLPFQLQLFHPGLYYNRVVTVNVVDGDSVRPIHFSPDLFDYEKKEIASRVPQDLGFAGFRVHAPIKSKEYYDEVIVFLGASYFRAVGGEQVFGLSARGLAIDTASPRGEEFPWFREFWIVTPQPGDTEIVIYALLDSASVAGAYRFAVTPGTQTVVHAEARLFLRKAIDKLGMAPLTSMFLHGENSLRSLVDYRPEEHDSDGLLLSFSGGEWLWRPLDNPHALQVSSLEMQSPAGFGLIQRDRSFDHYQDLETRPDRRPSLWVVPDGDWGRGRVELVEIPTEADTNDNIVAYWVPAQSPKPGEPFSFAYTMYWYGDDPTRPPVGRAVATRRDNGGVKGAPRFLIDFTGKDLAAIPADRIVRGVVTAVGGEESAEIADQQVVKNPVTGGWRLSFDVKPQKKGTIELRAFLDQGGQPLTETWSYLVEP